MARKTLSNEIQHDGAADTFAARQAENLRHWAAPKVEAARAWGEAGAAYGQFGGAVAAEEGRRKAKEVQSEYAPRVKDAAAGAQESLLEKYGKAAAAAATGVAAVAPAAKKQADTVQTLLAQLQDQAGEVGKDVRKKAEKARKDAEKKAKKAEKSRRRGAKKASKKTVAFAEGLQKDGRRTAKKASKKTAKNADRLQDRLAAGVSGATDAAGKGGLTAAGLLATAVAALQDGSRQLSPQVQERVGQAAQFAQDRRAEYAPKAAAALADAAGRAERSAGDVQVPTSVEQALIALTGDKKVVKHLRKGAQQRAHQAKKDFARQARAEKRTGGRGWILAGMAAAAAGAGLAVWKLTKPVQDPWTAPIPGPITANIPVVQTEGSLDPYAKQNQAVSEANAKLLGGEGRKERVVEVRPVVQNDR